MSHWNSEEPAGIIIMSLTLPGKTYLLLAPDEEEPMSRPSCSSTYL